VEQHFSNPCDEPLRVHYRLPFPADGALAGFRFRVGDRTITGEVRPRAAAREKFEQALVDGRTAALLEEERTSLFTQEIGNVPPRTDVYAEIIVDHPVVWLSDGSWEYRFPTVVAPRYLGAPGRINDAAHVSVPVAEGHLPPRVTLALTLGDPLAGDGCPTSPSHQIQVDTREHAVIVSLVDSSGVPLDRDLVVRWPVAKPEPGVRLEVARPSADHARSASAFGLLTIVPPAPAVSARSLDRDLIVLLDTSGSMAGEPLAQAVALVAAVVDSLTDTDRLEIVAFASEPNRWRPDPVCVTGAARAAAHEWLAHLVAGGGTEMTAAVREALRPLRDDVQRQVLVVTDGLVGFEHELVWHVLNCLPRSSRVHAVGVGPSVNRALTEALARAGRGAELIIAADEPVEAAARRLVARTRAPLAVGVEISGSAVRALAPVRRPDLMGGFPCMVSLMLSPDGGELVTRAHHAGADWEERLTVPPVECGTGRPAVVARFGREAVADLEMRIASDHRATRGDEILELGLAFGIATRHTSWIATTVDRTVDPTQPTRRIEMPQAIPHGLSVEGLGLRPGTRGRGMALTKGFLRVRLGGSKMFGARDEVRLDFGGRGRLNVPGLRRRRVRHLKGRIIVGVPDRLVVEFAVRGAVLVWQPPATVHLAFAEGASVEVPVVIEQCTAAGRIGAGLTVRLVLRLDESLAEMPRKVEVSGGDAPGLVIEIEAT
jgi:Ca-activated chloride channel family protein